jgi:molybdenum cofactor synthesis domain-containing protein
MSNVEKFQVAVLTISDRCSTGEATDTAGPAVTQLIEAEMLAEVKFQAILPDEIDDIKNHLEKLSDAGQTDLILTVGGTGFSTRDVTPEATQLVLERLTPGLNETMRSASAKITPMAMLSRACSGIRKRTLIINLPGSVKGATENLSAILPALSHGLKALAGKVTDCGR